MDFLTPDFLASAVRIATPLLFGAIGSIISERAGIFAVGIEGMMLAGAFGAAIAMYASGSASLGICGSMAGGAFIALVVAIVAVRYGADQMVTGLAVNVLAIGLTSFLIRTLIGGGSAPALNFPLLTAWPIPLLSGIPVVGPLLFVQPPLTYLALLLALFCHLFMMQTQLGLTLRSVGENPMAAFSIGANPDRIRIAAVVIGGAIAGLGGAVLVLQQVGTFTDAMTGGRGYLALAAIIVGRWMPFGSIVACVVFGAAEAFHLSLQMTNIRISSYVVQMLPYVIALAILSGLGRSVRLPAALGTPVDPHSK